MAGYRSATPSWPERSALPVSGAQASEYTTYVAQVLSGASVHVEPVGRTWIDFSPTTKTNGFGSQVVDGSVSTGFFTRITLAVVPPPVSVTGVPHAVAYAIWIAFEFAARRYPVIGRRPVVLAVVRVDGGEGARGRRVDAAAVGGDVGPRDLIRR